MRLLALILISLSSTSFASEEQALMETAKRMGLELGVVKQFYEQGCDSGRPGEQAICTTYGFVEADMQLNATYKRLLSELGTEIAKSKLKAAQRAWIRFRDQACEFEADGYAKGGDFTTVIANCKAVYTRERITKLERFVGCEDNYGCPGVK